MSAHRTLNDIARAFYTVVPGRLNDPGDGGAILVRGSLGIMNLVATTGAHTRTLAAPIKPGLIVTFCLESISSGSLAITVAGGYDQASGTVLTFGDAGDYVMLISVEVVSGTFVWRVVGFDGVTGPTMELSDLDVDTLVVDTLATIASAAIATANIPIRTITAAGAEHGDGAIGTAVAPVTTRQTVNGVIITTIKVDLTGLGCKGGNAGDAIGLVSGAPDAYIGRYVVATDGVVFKVEMACLEVPAGTGSATLDIDLVSDATGTYGYDEAIGGATVINNDTLSAGATLVAGEVLTNDGPALTGNDYLYLAEGDAAATDGVYTAGQFIITLYGHAVLVP